MPSFVRITMIMSFLNRYRILTESHCGLFLQMANRSSDEEALGRMEVKDNTRRKEREDKINAWMKLEQKPKDLIGGCFGKQCYVQGSDEAGPCRAQHKYWAALLRCLQNPGTGQGRWQCLLITNSTEPPLSTTENGVISSTSARGCPSSSPLVFRFWMVK